MDIWVWGEARSRGHLLPQPVKGLNCTFSDGRQDVAGDTDDALELVGEAVCGGVVDGGRELVARAGAVAAQEKYSAGGYVLDDLPLRAGRVTPGGLLVDESYGVVGAAGAEQAAELDLPQGEGVHKRGVSDAFEEVVVAAQCFVEQGAVAEFPGGAGQQGHRSRSCRVIRCDGDGVVQAVHGGADQAGFAQLVAVHPQGVRGHGWVAEVACDGQPLAGPAGCGGQPLLREDVAEGHAEADAGSGQQGEDIALRVPIRNTSLQAGDERPQLGDGFGGVSGLAGDLGETDGGVAELQHRDMVGVRRVRHAQDVGWQPKGGGDASARWEVVDCAAAVLDHGDVRLVVAEQAPQRGLGQAVYLAVEPQNRPQVTGCEDEGGLRRRPVPQRVRHQRPRGWQAAPALRPGRVLAHRCLQSGVLLVPGGDRGLVAVGHPQVGNLVGGEQADLLVFVAHDRGRVGVQDLAAVCHDHDVPVRDRLVDPHVEQCLSCRAPAGLFLDLPDHALLGGLAEFEATARQLPLVALVAQQQDAAVTADGNAFDGDREAARRVRHGFLHRDEQRQEQSLRNVARNHLRAVLPSHRAGLTISHFTAGPAAPDIENTTTPIRRDPRSPRMSHALTQSPSPAPSAATDRLSTSDLLFLDGLNSRSTVLDFATQIMDITPHPDSDPDGLTVIRDTGRHDGREGFAGLTNGEVLPHTERSSIPNPPRLMMLVCDTAATAGGQCLLADGHAIYDDLAEHNPEALEALSTPRSAYFGGADGHLGAIFTPGPDGHPAIRLRWDALVRFSPLAQPYLRVLRATIDRHQQVRTLGPGQGYVLDNTRWLHARTAFTGPRVCYRALGRPKELGS